MARSRRICGSRLPSSTPTFVFSVMALLGVGLPTGPTRPGGPGDATAAADRISVWPKNPYYWQYKGKPVLLLGGSDEDNLFNNPEMMMRNFEILRGIGGNYVRGTLSCRDEGNVWPYEKTADGRYDLDRFHPEFWDRIERCCREALSRDIIVQFEVWATFDYYREIWLRNPFNPKNNVNYSTTNTKLVEEWPHHPSSKVQPFFFSTPHQDMNNDRELLRYQEAFVRKLLDVTMPFPNVLYCLDNETRAPNAWADHWGRFIVGEAKKRDTTAQVTEMWDQWDLRHVHHSRTYRFPQRFSYTDVSQNNWQEGQTHYDRLIWFRGILRERPRPMNNVKVYGISRPSIPLDGPARNLDRWWQNIFAGCASTRFHRPPSGLGLNETAQEAIRAARIFTAAFDIFASEPRPDLLGDREENETYCLAKSGAFYALYFPNGGDIRLALPDERKTWTVRWFDPKKASFLAAEKIEAQSSLRLSSPAGGQTWLVLVD